MSPTEFQEARRSLGLSVNQAARILNTAPQTVRRWEMVATNSTARAPNPVAVRVMQWMLAGFRPPEFPDRSITRRLDE